MWPTSAWRNSKMRSAMPDVLSRCPARMNSGMASSGKLSSPGAMRCTTIVSGTTGLTHDTAARCQRHRERDRHLDGDQEPERGEHQKDGKVHARSSDPHVGGTAAAP